MANALKIGKNQAFLLTDKYYRRFFTNSLCEEGYVVLTENERVYFADARYYSAVKSELKDSDVKVLLYKNLNSVKAYLFDNGVNQLFIDYDTTSLTAFNAYKVFGVKILDGTVKLKAVRSVKSDAQIEYIKTACDISLKALENVLPYIKKGVSELSVKARLLKEMRFLGAEGESFDIIVAFGKNSAVPHHVSCNAKLKENSVVLIDFGCKVKGFSSDITRTYFYGTPTEKYINAFNAVVKANQNAQSVIRENMPCKDADARARETLKGYGLDKYFTHSLGHGIGLEIHESPYLSPKSRDKFFEGNVFSLEAGVYFENEFGIRQENTCTLKGGKVVSLSGKAEKMNIIKP